MGMRASDDGVEDKNLRPGERLAVREEASSMQRYVIAAGVSLCVAVAGAAVTTSLLQLSAAPASAMEPKSDSTPSKEPKKTRGSDSADAKKRAFPLDEKHAGSGSDRVSLLSWVDKA